MKFRIEVGEVNKHQIEYKFNQLLGRLVINLNQKPVKRRVRLFNEPLLETHVVHITEGERTAVRIEKERRFLFGQRCRVFLDGRLYRCFAGV
jgi:hypothetical protein